MSSPNVDYVTTYFEVPTLTKMHGEPAYKTLYQSKNQLKSNNSAVTRNLRGGSNGHLGLVCAPVEYVTVNPNVYMNPLHLGPLEIDVLAT